MTIERSAGAAAPPSVEEVMEVVRDHSGKAQPEMLRFLLTSAAIRPVEPGDLERPSSPQVRVAALVHAGTRVGVQVHTRWLVNAEQLRTAGVSGWPDNRAVDIHSVMDCSYQLQDSLGSAGEVLCRVSAVYHSWPYFREFAHSSLGRMQLPPLPIAVLNLSSAIAMAGFPTTGPTQADRLPPAQTLGPDKPA